MKNFQNFKILQIADNVTAANFVQVCFFFFWKLNKMRIVDKWL